MDRFFQDEWQGDDGFWYDIDPVNRSAFVPYLRRPEAGSEIREESTSRGGRPSNMNKRMVEFMRRSLSVDIETQKPDSKRCNRHMMSERLRRERERNGYLALHSLLPLGTKKDKSSIIQMAAKRIQELETYKRIMVRRNGEIEERLTESGVLNVESTKVRIEVANPSSGMDPMVDILKCLNSLGAKTRSVQSQISDQKLTAVMDIETEIEAAEIENAVKRTLASY